jgi:hypothetical protein
LAIELRFRCALHVAHLIARPSPALGYPGLVLVSATGLDYLSLTDLFTVGLALDITGAILLAKAC